MLREQKLEELNEIAEEFRRIIKEFGHLYTTIPLQHEPIFEEAKSFSLESVESYTQKLKKLKGETSDN